MFIVIGTLVLFLISLGILSRWIGERRYERAIKKTDYGVIGNFMCDTTNTLLGLSPTRTLLECSRYYLSNELGKTAEDSMKNA